jgi:hypothetical protein
MEPEFQPLHDEINLVRLLRRIEKSVDNHQDWKSSTSTNTTTTTSDPLPEVWLKAKKGLQVGEKRHGQKVMKRILLMGVRLGRTLNMRGRW